MRGYSLLTPHKIPTIPTPPISSELFTDHVKPVIQRQQSKRQIVIIKIIIIFCIGTVPASSIDYPTCIKNNLRERLRRECGTRMTRFCFEYELRHHKSIRMPLPVNAWVYTVINFWVIVFTCLTIS